MLEDDVPRLEEVVLDTKFHVSKEFLVFCLDKSMDELVALI